MVGMGKNGSDHGKHTCSDKYVLYYRWYLNRCWLRECPFCDKPHYVDESQTPQHESHTSPVGMQLQALWHTVEGTQKDQHWSQCAASIAAEIEANRGHISTFDNIYHHLDYLAAVTCGDITLDDIILILWLMVHSFINWSFLTIGLAFGL